LPPANPNQYWPIEMGARQGGFLVEMVGGIHGNWPPRPTALRIPIDVGAQSVHSTRPSRGGRAAAPDFFCFFFRPNHAPFQLLSHHGPVPTRRPIRAAHFLQGDYTRPWFSPDPRAGARLPEGRVLQKAPGHLQSTTRLRQSSDDGRDAHIADPGGPSMQPARSGKQQTTMGHRHHLWMSSVGDWDHAVRRPRGDY